MNQERNFGVPYPIYPNYQGMMIPNMMPNMPGIEANINTCGDTSNLESKINNLEKRISNIENYLNNNSLNNNYNNSNYQML